MHVPSAVATRSVGENEAPLPWLSSGASVMSAVLRDDGETARAEDIGDLLAAHGIVSVDIADVQAARADGSE